MMDSFRLFEQVSLFMAGILSHNDNTKMGHCTHTEAIIQTVFITILPVLEDFIKIPDLQE